jgi:hypothetical protein
MRSPLPRGLQANIPTLDAHFAACAKRGAGIDSLFEGTDPYRAKLRRLTAEARPYGEQWVRRLVAEGRQLLSYALADDGAGRLAKDIVADAMRGDLTIAEAAAKVGLVAPVQMRRAA